MYWCEVTDEAARKSLLLIWCAQELPHRPNNAVLQKDIQARAFFGNRRRTSPENSKNIPGHRARQSRQGFPDSWQNLLHFCTLECSSCQISSVKLALVFSFLNLRSINLTCCPSRHPFFKEMNQ